MDPALALRAGLDDAGPYLARGLAAADYDNDGDVDLAVATVGGRVGLLRNSGARGHWLAVAPDPPLPGTVVTIRPADGPAVRRELLAGSSYLSSEDPRLHFGVPSAAPVGVDVRWPDGSTAALDDVAVGQILVVAAG